MTTPSEFATKPLRILLVEDDEDTRDLMAEVLRSAGAHAVTLAATGESGLDYLRAETYDLLITDIGLPGLSGLDMLDAAERDGCLPAQTAIVVCSAAHSCSRVGAQFMQKPIDVDRIQRLINVRSAQASLPGKKAFS